MGKRASGTGQRTCKDSNASNAWRFAAARAQHKINPKPPNGITTLKRLYSMQDLGLDGTRGRTILAIG
jgi:hypothetical protein